MKNPTRCLPLLLFCAPLALAGAGCASSGAATFTTPEEAVHRLVAAAEDESVADELLGAGGFELLRSGDDVADREDLEAVVALVREGLAFEDLDADTKLALLGRERWELPIPLVREAGAWRFDVAAGREEILNRRVGRNELSTLATLRALVDAQREYAAQGRDGNPPAFAARIVSSPGKHDGLYWEAGDGEVPSPLGPLVAEAAEEGYGDKGAGPTPYHGYLYRLLTEQGAQAPGGARSYLDARGRLTGGWAVVAWPATHDNSGVMTFLVNQRGIVFQKDLGQDTAKAVGRIRA
ncbi:MAG TPA: DUF2950 domain-containing protein, partial [Planctomycetota bacterium]